ARALENLAVQLARSAVSVFPSVSLATSLARHFMRFPYAIAFLARHPSTVGAALTRFAIANMTMQSPTMLRTRKVSFVLEVPKSSESFTEERPRRVVTA